MSIIQILITLYFVFIGAYLSVLLPRLLRQNGRVLEKIDETLRKMDEGFRRTGEKIDEGFRGTGEKINEGFKLIARLIVEDNEKTRREILQALKSS